jgi:hypothetical protein
MQLQQTEMYHMLQHILSQSQGNRVILAATRSGLPTAMVPLQPPTSIKGVFIYFAQRRVLPQSQRGKGKACEVHHGALCRILLALL